MNLCHGWKFSAGKQQIRQSTTRQFRHPKLSWPPKFPDLKFTKRDYNEALLIRAATQQQHIQF